jgi:hypothetical protein
VLASHRLLEISAPFFDVVLAPDDAEDEADDDDDPDPAVIREPDE